MEVQNLTGRLPRSVLRKASREERLFHAAAFQPAGPKAAMSQKTFGYDYVPELRDLVAAAGIAVVAFTDMAGVLVSGAIGYTVATVAEYGMHRWGGHEARGPLKPLLEKSGRFGGKVSDYLTATYLGHFVIHHVKTSNKNYTTQFVPAPPAIDRRSMRNSLSWARSVSVSRGRITACR